MNPWPLVRRVEPQRDVRFVVPKLNVVAWAVLLDQHVLKKQRLLLRVRDDRFHVGHAAADERNVKALVPLVAKI